MLSYGGAGEDFWRVPCNTVQETEIKTIPIEKKCKKAKWLSEEGLQIAVKKLHNK